jgi:hypothetical protein
MNESSNIVEVEVSQVGVAFLCYLPSNFLRSANRGKSSADRGSSHDYSEFIPEKDPPSHLGIGQAFREDGHKER